MPTSVETYLTSPRLDCLEREQRQGSHLCKNKYKTFLQCICKWYCITEWTRLEKAFWDHQVQPMTLDLHHFTFPTYPSVFLEDFISLTWLFYIFILFFTPSCDTAEFHIPKQDVPHFSSLVTCSRRVSINNITISASKLTFYWEREGMGRKWTQPWDAFGWRYKVKTRKKLNTSITFSFYLCNESWSTKYFLSFD